MSATIEERIEAALTDDAVIDRALDALDCTFAEERTEYPRNRLHEVSQAAQRDEARKLLRAVIA